MMLPRKVLHVLNSASGGAALSTLGLITSLREMGVEACAVCHNAGLPGDFDALRDATRGNLLITPLYWWNRKIRAKTWKRPLLELRQLYLTGCIRKSTRQVATFARQQQADLIHSNTILTLEGGYAARQLGLPHVWHLRELVGPNQPFRFYREGAAFGQFVAKLADRVIANSNVSAELVRNWLPAGLLEVVPNGIDLRPFNQKNHLDSQKPLIVGMVGNLTSAVKKHSLFIAAASLVNRRLPIEFRIYGFDPSHAGTLSGNAYTNALYSQVRSSNLNSRLHFVGHVADPTHLMAEIDILVHPANQESFGRIAVEGMAAGLPVIGVDGGGIAEIVQHGVTGLIVPPDDAQALATAVEAIVQSAEHRHQYGTAGRHRAEQFYSLSACAAGVAKIYSQLLSASGSNQDASSEAFPATAN